MCANALYGEWVAGITTTATPSPTAATGTTRVGNRALQINQLDVFRRQSHRDDTIACCHEMISGIRIRACQYACYHPIGTTEGDRCNVNRWRRRQFHNWWHRGGSL